MAIFTRVNRRDRFAAPFLVGLILLAAALRWYGLASQDLWGDEAFSISLSLKPLSYVIAGGSDTHPPFYPLLLYGWLKLTGMPVAGAGVFAARTLSVLIGIAAVPLAYVFSRRLAPRRAPVAWYAAALVAVSPLFVYYSQETRMYELVAVLALASAYWALRVAGDRTWTAGSAASFLVWTLLSAYTHYQAFFALAAVNLVVLLSLLGSRRDLLRWLGLQVLVVVAYMPWILVQTAFLNSKGNRRFDEWSWRGVEIVFGKSLQAFAAGLTAGGWIVQAATAGCIVICIFGILSLSGSRWTWRRSRPIRVNSPDAVDEQRTSSSVLPAVGVHVADRMVLAWLAPALFVVPLVIAWIVNPIMPFFFERYVLVALPGFYVTISLGLDMLGRRSRVLALGAAGLIVTICVYSLQGLYFNDAYAKGKYGQMMALVTAQARAGDGLVLNNPLQKPLYDYYRPVDMPAVYLPDGAPLEDPDTRARLVQFASSHARVWLVMFGNPAEYDPTGYLERWLGTHAFKTLSRGFVDASLSLYVMPDSGTTIHRDVQAELAGAIRLTGYDLDRDQIRPGDTLQLVLHWRAVTPVEGAFKVFTHLIGDINPETGSPVWAQMDGEPAGGSRPTNRWAAGETVEDLYGLRVPARIPSGQYTLEVGMYDPKTGERLPVRDATGERVPDNRIILGEIRVESK